MGTTLTRLPYDERLLPFTLRQSGFAVFTTEDPQELVKAYEENEGADELAVEAGLNPDGSARSVDDLRALIAAREAEQREAEKAETVRHEELRQEALRRATVQRLYAQGWAAVPVEVNKRAELPEEREGWEWTPPKGSKLKPVRVPGSWADGPLPPEGV